MPIKLEYNSKFNYLTILGQGHITLKEVESAIKDMFDSTEYASDVNALWDVRELEFSDIDIEFVKGLVAIRRQYNRESENTRIAILSNYILAAPIIKLYTILSSNLGQKTRTFKTVVEAELWLCEGL